LIAWRTEEGFCSGLPPGAYDILAVRITLTAAVCGICPIADWPVDLTTDPWFNLDYPITDSDPGQPLELFGVGFGPEYTYTNWTEFGTYVGGDDQKLSPRDPYPFVFDVVGAKVHVEDSVKAQFTPTPWAIGVPVGYTPGRQAVPFPVHFDVNLTLSEDRVRRHFQEQLSAGRLVVAVTSFAVTFKQAPAGFPSFFTKEGLGLDPNAEAPRLVITLTASGNPDGDGDRDREDWAGLAGCLAGPEVTPHGNGTLNEAACLCVFDFDEDGDVDLRDVGEFMRRAGPL